MPQNRRRGRGGRGAVDPDTNPRSMSAKPAPEQPIGEVPAAGDDDSPAPAPPGGKGDGAGPSRDEKAVLAEIKSAQGIVDGLEVELAGIREESQRKKDNDQVVADYKAQLKALKAEAAALELFRTAEITFLEKMLPAAARGEVAKVAATLQAELDALATKAGDAQKALDAQKDKLDGAKAEEAAATATLDKLMKPAEPIQAMLKDGEALRTAANKAEETSDYALAFWLVREGGRLQQKLQEQPIPDADKLRTDIEQAQKKQTDARADIAKAEPKIAPLEEALAKAKAEYETEKSTLEGRILKRVSELNPKPAESAKSAKPA